MSEVGSHIGFALRRIAFLIENLNSTEIERLLDPSFEVELKFTKQRGKAENNIDTQLDLNAITAKLISFASRVEASNYMQEILPAKRQLELIARHLDISVLKQDKADTLRDKIVEATTGAKLRSEAIKGSA